MSGEKAAEFVMQAWQHGKISFMLGTDYFVDAYITFLQQKQQSPHV